MILEEVESLGYQVNKKFLRDPSFINGIQNKVVGKDILILYLLIRVVFNMTYIKPKRKYLLFKGGVSVGKPKLYEMRIILRGSVCFPINTSSTNSSGVY